MFPQTPNVVDIRPATMDPSGDVDPPKPPQSRRHGAPAGPWPWTDFDQISQKKSPSTDNHMHDWSGYPQSLFPNWSPTQVKRSGIDCALNMRGRKKCVVRSVDIKKRLPFEKLKDLDVKLNEEFRFWEEIQRIDRPKDVRVRALFLDRPLGPVLQMLGTKYKIEPFFFSSSLNRIPTQYREENLGEPGDHITITLPFLCRLKHHDSSSYSSDNSHEPYPTNAAEASKWGFIRLPDGILDMELLAIHMIRSPQGNTLISFHPDGTRPIAAEHLQSRILDAGHSVYWTKIFESSSDPTFVLLIYLWYALYAWDQALEHLYNHVSKLERKAIENDDTDSAPTLHTLHAHLLNYTPYLCDFSRSVEFILDTPNPTLEVSPFERSRFEKECNNLLLEIKKLEMTRNICAERLKNAMNLLFNKVNLQDSEHMRKLTAVTVRDSHAMKQVSILTMIFLPASFSASVFGMNIQNLTSDTNIKGTLAHYFETAIPLTILTIWFIVASQRNAPGSRRGGRWWQRLAWPVYLWRDRYDDDDDDAHGPNTSYAEKPTHYNSYYGQKPFNPYLRESNTTQTETCKNSVLRKGITNLVEN